MAKRPDRRKRRPNRLRPPTHSELLLLSVLLTFVRWLITGEYDDEFLRLVVRALLIA